MSRIAAALPLSASACILLITAASCGQESFPFAPPVPSAGQGTPSITATSIGQAPRAPGSTVSSSPALRSEPGGAAVFEPAETAARVGDQYIFMGELIGDANIMIALATGVDYSEMNPQRQAAVAGERKKLVKQLLDSAVDQKLMYIEFLRDIPAEKLDEALATIDKKVGENFRTNLFEMLDKVNTVEEDAYPTLIRQDARLFRLAYLMKKRNLLSLGQLDRVLRANGSSLKKQQTAYAERALGQQQMRDSIDRDPEVTYSEIAEYYQENLAKFEVPARAKWRQVTIRFNRCESKEQAGDKIAALGNELYLGGAPFWAVAKRSSHGPKKSEGGLHDWTERGNLEISKPIEAAVFSIPLNKLSHIIRDAEGLHILLVLDRTEAHVVPFAEAQVDIKQALQNQKRNKSIAKYVVDLKGRTPVWK